MKELFSAAGQQALREFVREGLLCLFDFDGTLVPLEPHPEQVNVPAAVFERLRRLQQRTPVGIVTGRGLADMHRMLPFAPDYLIGNHGIEGLPGWEDRAGVFETICEGWREQIGHALTAIDPQIWIEYKRYSLSVHYLHAHHPAEAAQRMAQLFASLTPAPRVITGKHVFNLLPPGASDKGRAVAELMALTGASRALYAGDDVTDEHVFALGREDIFTIRVGHSPDSAADFHIPDHESIVQLLDWLIEGLPALRTTESGLPSGVR